MKHLKTDKNFLGIPEKEFFDYESSRYVIQSAPYEYTSSYIAGSAKGPQAMINASQFVEFYDEELGLESYKNGGICTLPAMNFNGKTDRKAIELIKKETLKLLKDGKFPVTLGAEHTITLGVVEAIKEYYPRVHVLQFDAHSDLRQSYHGNKFSHASVMARVHDLGVPLTQIGIRAQCKEESELRRASKNIHTFYAHEVRSNANWGDAALKTLGKDVYISIDADGFDPSWVPAVGTAEPNGLFWQETVDFLKRVMQGRRVLGFDLVEIAPVKGSIITEYAMAKLVYKLIGLHSINLKKATP